MKLKVTIQEIFDREGVHYKPTVNSLMIRCPSCEKDKKKRAVRKTNGGNKCYYCGNYMSFTELLKKLQGYSTEEIANKYGLQANVAETIQEDYSDIFLNIESILADKSEEEKKIVTLTDVTLDAFFIPIEQSKEGMEYLIKRGVKSPKIWIDYDIHFHKIMGGPVFPVKLYGKTVGWQCRKINPTKDGPRMLSMPGEWKSKTLLNYDNGCLSEEVGLFEGPFDALAAESAGLVSMATLGKIISKRQIELLKECGASKIYLGFDPDAYLEVRDFCRDLCKHKDVYRLVVPEHRDDFGDCTPEEIRFAKENAEPCYAEKTGRIELYLDF